MLGHASYLKLLPRLLPKAKQVHQVAQWSDCPDLCPGSSTQGQNRPPLSRGVFSLSDHWGRGGQFVCFETGPHPKLDSNVAEDDLELPPSFVQTLQLCSAMPDL